MSHLLKWHLQDPVSEEESIRNDKICNLFQKNRNPFVDYPDLLTRHGNEGFKDLVDNTHCSQSCEKRYENDDTGPNLQPGDFAVIGYNIKKRDKAFLLALTDIEAGTRIFVTDNGFYFLQFFKNEIGKNY